MSIAKTNADLHDVEVKYLNKLINNNESEFDDGIDIMNLKDKGDYKEPLFDLGFTPKEFANYNNINILSEQGYMALVQLMRTEKRKKSVKNFVENTFP